MGASMLIFLTFFLAISAVFVSSLQANRAIIPAYFFPTDQKWDMLLESIERSNIFSSRIYVILNANNGVIRNETLPVQDLWKSLAQDRLKHVSRILCYVNLCNKVPPFDECGEADLQGARPAEEVLGYVDDWIDVIGASHIDGFFLDDTPMDGTNRENILEIINGIKLRKKRFKVVSNPGVAATDTELIERVTATIYDEGFSPDSTPPPRDVVDAEGNPFGRLKFAMILNTVANEDWANFVDTARLDGYGYFYATNGSYSELPSYIDSLLDRIFL